MFISKSEKNTINHKISILEDKAEGESISRTLWANRIKALENYGSRGVRLNEIDQIMLDRIMAIAEYLGIEFSDKEIPAPSVIVETPMIRKVIAVRKKKQRKI